MSSPPNNSSLLNSPSAASFGHSVSASAQLANFNIKVGKKISLKHFEFPNDLSSEVRHAHMATVSHSLDSIFSATYPEDSSWSMEMLYRSVEMLCKYNHGRALYDQVNRAIEGYCVRELKPLIHNNPQHQSGSNLGGHVLGAWQTLQEKLGLVEATFAYLFEVWIHRNGGSFVGLRRLSAGHFRQHALGSKAHELVRLVNAKIGPGYPREDSGIRQMLQMLHQLSLMPQVMQSIQEALTKFPILEGDLAQGFAVYEDFVSEFASLLPTEEYQQEYLASLREGYLQKYVALFPKWIPLMISEGLQREFLAMAHISKACNQVNEFVSVFKGSLKEYARKQIFSVDLDAPERCISLLVQLMDTLTSWFSAFPFLPADVVNEAVEAALNLNSELSAELLCCYCNALLLSDKISSAENYGDRAQQRASAIKTNYMMEEEVTDPLLTVKISNPQVIQEVDKVIRVLRLVHAKEHFELVYRRLFSRRIVAFVRAGKPSAKGQVEYYLIERLELELGLAYVSKLKAIYREVHKGIEYDDVDYGVYCFVPDGIWAFSLPTGGVDIATQGVLDYGYESWSYWDKFFREDKRILKLIDALCVYQVSLDLASGPVSFLVSLPHAAILALFKDQTLDTVLPIEELYKNSGINNKELFTRALKTLSSSKLPILVKEQQSGYRFNYELQVHEKRIQILLYSRKELLALDCPLLGQAAGPGLKSGSEESVPLVIDPALKGHQLEAAIVRTLKKQKTMKPEELKKAVQEVLVWRVEELDWTRHLESLKEREFIQMTSDDINYIP